MKNKKIMSVIAIASIVFTSSTAYAIKKIGELKVGWPDIQNVDINWDETYPINGSGSVTGIKVKAVIEPQIDMSISASEINLWLLTSASVSSWSLDIEVGTNAKGGVNLTVKSTKWGLENKQDATIKLNNETSNIYKSDYKFSSTNQNIAPNLDSTIAGFAVGTVLAETQVLNNTTEHIIYKTNKPENFDETHKDLKFNVSAKPNSQAPAGEYEDILTFTITGNF